MPDNNKNFLPIDTLLENGSTQYRIERHLGSGGFGITYLATGSIRISDGIVPVRYCVKEYFQPNDCWRDRTTNAVSYSQPAEQRFSDGKKDFIAEAKRLQNKIRHSHIVRVADVFEANNTAYYVMEFLEGKTLREYIQKCGALDEEETLAILLPVIRALGYLHELGITHLDVKPDNIMIVESGGKIRPVLIDFGLSKHYDKKGRATSTVRVQAVSNGYSPIEQYQGIETFQPTADIYALGATYFFCITGYDPKKSADIHPGELKQTLEEKITSRALTAILHSMTPSPYGRTQTIRDFMAELCPWENSDNWDIETENTITVPSFFSTKKNSETIFSKLRNLFSKKKTKNNLLKIPDDCIQIRIDYPEDNPLFSKELFLSCLYAAEVTTRKGKKFIDNIDFFGRLSDEVEQYLLNSGLLEYRHWENENLETEEPSHGIDVSISLHYLEGEPFVRSLQNVSQNNRLYLAVLGLLQCKSLYNCVYDYESRIKEETPTKLNYIPSNLLAYHNGVLMTVALEQWTKFSETEKSEWKPFIIELDIDTHSRKIGMFVEEFKGIEATEIPTILDSLNRQLNPALPDNDTGRCRLLTLSEWRTLDKNIDALINTFSLWGLPHDFNRLHREYHTAQWAEDNGKLTIFGMSPTADPNFINKNKHNLWIYANYYGTVQIYSPDDVKEEEKPAESIELNSYEFTAESLTVCVIPEDTNQYLKHIIHFTRDNFRIAEIIDKIPIRHRDDDMVPVVAREFQDKTESLIAQSGVIIPAIDVHQFLVATKYLYALKKLNPSIEHNSRILNPITLCAFWKTLISKKPAVLKSVFLMERYELMYDFEKGLFTVNSLKPTKKTYLPINWNDVVKGATVQKLIMSRDISSLLLVEYMEYEIGLAVKTNGTLRDYIRLYPANSTIPLRKDKNIPYDLIREFEIYIVIGGHEIPVDISPCFGSVGGDGIATMRVDIDANKLVKFIFKNQNQENIIELGELLQIHR